MCFVTSTVLLVFEGKDFSFDFPCNSSSFIFNSNCNFSFSISIRSSRSLSFSLSRSSILTLICPFLFVFLSLYCPSISNLIFSYSNFLSTTYLLVLLFPALFFPLALLSHVSISFHALHFLPLFCLHVLTLIFPSQPVWVAEWPPFGKKLPAGLAICSHCILSICNIYLFPALVLRAGFAF